MTRIMALIAAVDSRRRRVLNVKAQAVVDPEE